MQDILGIVHDFFCSGKRRLRSHLTGRLEQDLAISADQAKGLVRGLLEDRVIDHVTLCFYEPSVRGVVMEPGVVPGANYHQPAASASAPLVRAAASAALR
jgi:hypothetical protein